MAKAKFGAGQRVTVARSTAFAAPSGVFRIVSVLPLERGPRQYRVKSDGEAFDRIIEEARLSPAEE